ncbi:MAG TPA: hypothetical protein VFP65_16910 [Anaeromyxobacteraceae bacterium]|nr:hypothetical protein [Anaeromyxobacteraceae bacterium]
MLVCPLCEESQPPAEACRVCGRPLQGPGVARAPVEPDPGLEPTRLDDAGPLIGADPVPGLEPTRLDDAPEAPAGDASWVERTAAEDVGPVGVEPLEVERIAPEAPAPRAALAAAACRYCGEVAGAADAFCGGCGMKVQRYRPAAPR